MMKLKQLLYFIAVAEEGGVGRAASRLNMSQPPLTRQISLLEEELGVRLFNRHLGGVSLTEAGEILLIEARQICSSVKLAVDRTQRAGRGDLGRLDIGVFGSGVLSHIPEIIHQFRGRYPGIDVAIHSMNKDQQLQALRNGTIHIAFNRLVKSEPDITVECVVREKLFVGINVDHPLAKDDDIPFSSLEKERFVLFPSGSLPGFKDKLLQICYDFGFSPMIAQEAEDTLTCVFFVASGLGVSLVPESATAIRLPTVVYKELRDLPESSRVDLSCLYSTTNNSPILRRFLEITREFAETALGA
nr:B167 [uncultured bacterium]